MYKRKFLGYASTVLPSLISFIQLYILYFISSTEANVFYIDISLFIMLSGILALNTGYVFIIRAGDFENKYDIRNEYSVICLFRICTFFVIVIPVIILFGEKLKIFIIVFAFFKLLIEMILIYFRATDQISRLFKIIVYIAFFDLLALILCYYFKESFMLVYSITNLICFFLILPKWSLFKNLKPRMKKNIIKDYFDKIKPLSLSSIRENITGAGLIFFTSKLLNESDLELLINGIKIYSVGIILIGVYSNFYIQDIIRKGRNLKDELFLYFSLIGLYTILHLILIKTEMFSNIGNELDSYLILFFVIGVLLQSRYFIFQSTRLINKSYPELYIFELSYIVSFFCIVFYGNFNYIFIVNFLCLTLSFTILKIKKLIL